MWSYSVTPRKLIATKLFPNKKHSDCTYSHHQMSPYGGPQMNKFELVSIDDHHQVSLAVGGQGPKFDVRVEGGVPGLISMERGWGVGAGTEDLFFNFRIQNKTQRFLLFTDPGIWWMRCQ